MNREHKNVLRRTRTHEINIQFCVLGFSVQSFFWCHTSPLALYYDYIIHYSIIYSLQCYSENNVLSKGFVVINTLLLDIDYIGNMCTHVVKGVTAN